MRPVLRSAAVSAALALTLLTPAIASATPATSGPAPDAAAAKRTAVSPAYPKIPALTDREGRVITLRGWNVEDKGNRGADALSAITRQHFRSRGSISRTCGRAASTSRAC